MSTYTVHAPPPRKGQSADPERFVFVRDGFHFWAFLLGPLWLLARRLWLVFMLYAIVMVVLGVALKLSHVPATVQLVASAAIALLIGFEAGTLRRWTLGRRGWQMLGFVVGEHKEMAERRFYLRWLELAGATPAPPAPPPAEPRYAPPVRRGPPSGSDVIGLFPQPGGAS